MLHNEATAHVMCINT